MQDLNITVVQTRLHWENAAANRAKFDALLDRLAPAATDLIVLPEMFSTGFSMQPEKLAETMDGATVQWMEQQAKQRQAVLTGSVIITENEKYYNRLVWMRPDGTYDIYDKRHLFSMANEQAHYTAGTERLIVELKGWRVCPLVCYDLRFPVWSRNDNAYDLLLYVANWPHRRSNAWKQLLMARAIENQAYVVGVNRTGNDGNDVYHAGYSGLVGPTGDNADLQAHEEHIHTYVLSADHLEVVRRRFPFLPDADQFEIHV